MDNALTGEQVLEEIRRLARKNRKLLNSKRLARTGMRHIVYAASKHYGSWHAAVRASGEKPLYRKWTKEKVVKEILTLHAETDNIPRTTRKKGESKDLRNAARMYWGDWQSAMKAAGLRPHRKSWTKKDVLEEFSRVVGELGYIPSSKELRNGGRHDIHGAIRKHYGTYNAFLVQNGHRPVLIPNYWTKKKIAIELQKAAEKIGRTPTERDMIVLGRRTVISASWKYFGGWNPAIEAAGLQTNESFVKDKTWKAWEDFAIEACKLIYPNAIGHFRLENATIPDALDPNSKTIIEIKLNGSDPTIHSDIKTYAPFCDHLEIWYLTGVPVRNKRAIFRGPKYVENLVKNNPDLLIRFQKIQQECTHGKTKKGLSAWIGRTPDRTIW